MQQLVNVRFIYIRNFVFITTVKLAVPIWPQQLNLYEVRKTVKCVKVFCKLDVDKSDVALKNHQPPAICTAQIPQHQFTPSNDAIT